MTVLDMHRHRIGQKDHSSRLRLSLRIDTEVTLDVAGESVLEQLHFGQGMDRRSFVALLKIVDHDGPEHFERGIPDKLIARLFGTCHAATTTAFEGRLLRRAGKGYRARDVATLQGCPMPPQGIFIFLRRTLMIDGGHLLVMPGNESFSLQIGDGGLEKLHDLFDGVLSRKDKPSVGQPLMTVEVEGCTDGRFVGGHEGNETSLVVVIQQRMVGKPIAMIVHIVPLEEECPVLRITDKCVPHCLVGTRIATDVHAWARYLRYSSKSRM